MSETQATRAGYPTHAAEYEPEATGWVGWVLFAGVMLMLVGAFQAMVGFVALFDDTYYVTNSSNLVIHMDYTAWGWAHLALALFALFAGWGIVTGRTWARVVGITIAFIGAVGNLAFLSAYPVWGVILITVDIIVIFALAVHGREAKYLH